jgi:hypothetical protein
MMWRWAKTLRKKSPQVSYRTDPRVYPVRRVGVELELECGKWEENLLVGVSLTTTGDCASLAASGLDKINIAGLA